MKNVYHSFPKLIFVLLLIACSQPLNLEKSVGSRFLAQTIDSTALQKNTRLTEWLRLRFIQNTVKPMVCTINPCPTDLSRLKRPLSTQVKLIGLPSL